MTAKATQQEGQRAFRIRAKLKAKKAVPKADRLWLQAYQERTGVQKTTDQEMGLVLYRTPRSGTGAPDTGVRGAPNGAAMSGAEVHAAAVERESFGGQEELPLDDDPVHTMGASSGAGEEPPPLYMPGYTPPTGEPAGDTSKDKAPPRQKVSEEAKKKFGETIGNALANQVEASIVQLRDDIGLPIPEELARVFMLGYRHCAIATATRYAPDDLDADNQIVEDLVTLVGGAGIIALPYYLRDKKAKDEQKPFIDVTPPKRSDPNIPDLSKKRGPEREKSGDILARSNPFDPVDGGVDPESGGRGLGGTGLPGPFGGS